MYPSVDERTAYIIQAAQARGIDPETALAVARSEGLKEGAWQSQVPRQGPGSHNGFEDSWADFQLYKGGGLGNEMQARTGLDPADPANWQKSVDFALDHAKSKGWGAWYGARNIGVTGFQGINGTASAPESAAAGVRSAGTAAAENPLATSASATTTPEGEQANPLTTVGKKLSQMGGAYAAQPLSLAMYGQRRPSFT